MRGIVPPSDQLFILLEMIGIASEALSECFGYMKSEIVLKGCSGPQCLFSRLLYQDDNIYLLDYLAPGESIQDIMSIHH